MFDISMGLSTNLPLNWGFFIKFVLRSMIFDLEMIKKVYSSIKLKVDSAKKICKHPLTLSEKILYSHLWNEKINKPFTRGQDYVDFAPDRIACQDATAQMALLQFMQAGKKKVSVPTTVHCDHLIQARIGADEDLQSAINLSLIHI